MNITIIGAGNAGCAHAFEFSGIGHEVTLVKTSHSLHEDNYEAIRENGGIYCVDDTEHKERSFRKIHKITRDIADGLENADLVIIMTQSTQHLRVAELVCNELPESVRMILILPGNLGSLIFRKYLKNVNIILAEGESTIYDARIIEPGVVNIICKNHRNALAFLPVSGKIKGMEMAGKLSGTYSYTRRNIIESSFNNPNIVSHTIGTIVSASRVEMAKGEFWMYRESFSPSVWNLVNDLDKERNDVIEAFKGERISYLDAGKFRHEKDLSRDSYEVFLSYAAAGAPKGPASLDTRYLYEDVGIGLCLLSLFGKKFNIPTPVTDALITIASSLINSDLRANARTFDDLGLSGMSNEEIISYINS